MGVLRVGMVGYSGQKFDEKHALALIKTAYDTITARNPQYDVTIVSGLTNVGIPAIAYAEATRRGWRTAGIACKKAAEYDCFPVDEEPTLVGEEWGDESPAFIATIDALIRVGGGKHLDCPSRLHRPGASPPWPPQASSPRTSDHPRDVVSTPPPHTPDRHFPCPPDHHRPPDSAPLTAHQHNH